MRRLSYFVLALAGVVSLVAGVALATEAAGSASGFWVEVRGWIPAGLIAVGAWRLLSAFDRNWGIIGAAAVAVAGVVVLLSSSDILGEETTDSLGPPSLVFLGLGLLAWVLLGDRGRSDRSSVWVLTTLGRRRLKLVSKELESVKAFILLGRLDLDLSGALPSHTGVAIETWVVAGHMEISVGEYLQPIRRTVRSGGRSTRIVQVPLAPVAEDHPVVTLDEILLGGDTNVTVAS